MLALNINQWSENEKGLYLAVALRGQAQGILGDLSIDKQQDLRNLNRPGNLPTDAHQSPYILVLTDQPVRIRSLVL
jgi:hypothetical protein